MTISIRTHEENLGGVKYKYLTQRTIHGISVQLVLSATCSYLLLGNSLSYLPLVFDVLSNLHRKPFLFWLKSFVRAKFFRGIACFSRPVLTTHDPYSKVPFPSCFLPHFLLWVLLPRQSSLIAVDSCCKHRIVVLLRVEHIRIGP